MLELFANLCSYAFRQQAREVYLRDGQNPSLLLHGQVVTIPGAPALEENTLRVHLWPLFTPEQRQQLDYKGWVECVVELPKQGPVLIYSGTESRGAFALVRPLPWDAFHISKLPESVQLWRHYNDGIVILDGGSLSGNWALGWEFVGELLEWGKSVLLVENEGLAKYLPVQSGLLHWENSQAILPNALGSLLNSGLDVLWIPKLEGDFLTLALEAAEAGVLVITHVRSVSTNSILELVIDGKNNDLTAWHKIMFASQLRGVALMRILAGRNSNENQFAWEILVNTPQVASAIRSGEFHRISLFLKSGAAEGMLALDDSLLQLVQQKKIESSQALQYASELSLFDARR